MNDNVMLRKQLKNAEGKRQLAKTLLEYSKEIINELNNNPESIIELLDELEISETEFFSYISGDVKGNISFYNQTLYLIKEKKFKAKN